MKSGKSLKLADLKSVIAIILGGGRGERLHPLTQYRAKPAVPVVGKYRLVDIPISNCINSYIRNIFVLTQFNSASLNKHINLTYKFDVFNEGFVEVLADEQTTECKDWFKGTADAVRQCLHHFEDRDPSHYLILSGDQLYTMDFKEMIAHHISTGAELSIAANVVSRDKASEYGIMKIDKNTKITAFVEKTSDPAILDDFKLSDEAKANSGIKSDEDLFLASMGIYIFNPKFMRKALEENLMEDFGKHIIPGLIEHAKVCAYPFDGYWEDVGTVKSYYEASLIMTRKFPPFDLYSPASKIYTRPRYLPNSKFYHSNITHSLVAEGSIVEGATIVNSVVGLRSVIFSGVFIKDAILLGCDYYENLVQAENARNQGLPPLGIGNDTHIERAIVDKNVRMGRNVRIINKDNLMEFDCPTYSIRDGIVVIKKGAIIADNTVI
jgi:glucose-1-phosphate adenylyltransferase